MVLVAIRLRSWPGACLFLILGLISLCRFAYLTVASRRFYLRTVRWGGRLLSVAVAMLIYVLNTGVMTAVQVATRGDRPRFALGTCLTTRSRYNCETRPTRPAGANLLGI